MRRNASQFLGRSARTPGFGWQDYDDIVRECKRNGQLFEDSEFRAVDESVFFSKRPPKPFEWKRPKEICANPQFISDGASRFDVQQGMLGNPWMVAALASLTSKHNLLSRVIFSEQSFSGPDYVGCFKFQFYYQGAWTEVVVDDRLPTYNNKLVFQHSESRDEFWSALLEKAYAKMKGSYEGLKEGQTAEAMVDFTGGVVEAIDLKDPKLFQYLLKAKQRGSLLGCSISAASHEREAKMDNGLIKGHAYSITAVKKVQIKTSRVSMNLDMVRLRNPWGNEREWTGAWSDKSREWSLVSESERTDIGLTFDDDGEFWMSFDDWKKNFDQLEICNLGPDSLKDSGSSQRSWEGKTIKGEWVPSVSAGGCRNFPDTFHLNPQFSVVVKDCDDDNDDKGTLVVSLMQLERRREKRSGGTMLQIGYAIYKVDDRSNDQPLSKDFFLYNKSDDRSPSFTNSREVTGRHNLVPGTYVIVPSTFDPNIAGKFMLRVFTEKEVGARELDEETTMVERKEDVPETEMDSELDEKLMKTFERLAGVDREIDAYELKDILNTAFGNEFRSTFSSETCRSMVAMYDVDVTGKLGFSEFKLLWSDLRIWKGTFKKYDADRSGKMNSYELRQALSACGYRLSNGTLSAAVMRYSNKEGHIEFDDFVLCLVRLKTTFSTFNDCKEGSKAEFTLDEFIKITLYS